jgi:hypothetical protein
MRKLLLVFALIAVSAGAQTITFTDSTAQRTGWVGPGSDMTHDSAQSQPLANYLILDPGFEPFLYSALIGVNTLNTGTATFFNTGQTFAFYEANDMAGATYTMIRNGAQACTGTINGNSSGGSGILSAVLSGSTIGSVTVNTASLPGLPNGTYSAYVTSGGGSGGAITYTVSGSTFIGGTTGYTGGTITAAVTNAGTGYTSTPTVKVVNGLSTTSCGASGGFQNATGDYVIVRKTFSPTTAAQWPSLGWAVSGTVSAETSDLPSGDLPPGTSDTQAMVLDATSANASTTSDWDAGNGGGGQNWTLMTGPLAGKISAKTTTGTATLNWSVQRLSAGGFNCSGSLSLTTSWQTFNFGSGCSPAETASVTGPWAIIQITFSVSHSVSPNVVYIDNASLQDTATNTNGTAFNDPTVAALQAYNGGVRILDNQLTYPLSQILQPDVRGVSPIGFTEGCNAGTPIWQCNSLPSITLPIALALRDKIGNGRRLWYVIPATTNMVDTTEAATLAQYMGGTCTVAYPTCTCGTTGATLRCQQNKTTPWTTELAAESTKVDFEIGNENWNSSFAGNKWLYVPALGSSEYAPYGYASQSVCSSAKADGTYNAATEEFVIGAQTAGAGTTFSMGVLANPSTGISLSCDTISQAPYFGFSMTSSGFDTATPISKQAVSNHAEVFYNNNNSSGTMKTLSNAGYSTFNLQIYEMNGSGPASPATGVPTQTELMGYDDGWTTGMANAIQSLEACAGSNFCGFQGAFSQVQFNQTAGNGSPNTFTATTTNGSNAITGVSSLTNLDVGVGLASNANMTGSVIQAIVGTTIYTSKSATVSGSITFSTATTNLSGRMWGLWAGIGAQNYNNQMAGLVGMSLENATIPNGASMITSAWTSRVTQAFTGVNGIPSQAAVPTQYAYGFKSGSNRTYLFICDDWTGATCSFTIAGAAISGTVTKNLIAANTTDTNDTALNVTPVTSSVSMPTTYTAPAFSMTTFQGTTGTPTAATPTFSPVGGTYAGTQSVTISTASGGVICYTTNGTTPATNGSSGCTTGTLYTTAVSVATSETVKAIAGGTGFLDGSVGSAAYVINVSAQTVKMTGNIKALGSVQIK